MCRTALIYRIVNNLDGKCYIGSAYDLTRRKAQHYYDSRGLKTQCKLLYRAVNKHGWDNFTFELLEINVCPIAEVRNSVEDFWMTYFNSRNPKFGYNLRSADCKNMSDETREKIRKGNTGKVISAESRKKMSAAKIGKPSWIKGRKASEETREKLRKSHLGKKDSEATKEKKRMNFLGRKHTAESIAKMRKAKSGKTFSEEHKANLSKVHSGLKWSPARRDAYERKYHLGKYKDQH